MKRLVILVALLVACAAPAAVSADVGHSVFNFYENNNFNGQHRTFHWMNDTVGLGLNDLGAYTEEDCNDGEVGIHKSWNNCISSAVITVSPGRCMKLYKDKYYGGNALVFTNTTSSEKTWSVSDMGVYGFQDNISSFRLFKWTYESGCFT